MAPHRNFHAPSRPKGRILPCGRVQNVPVTDLNAPSQDDVAKRALSAKTLRERLDKYVQQEQLNRSQSREKILEVVLEQTRHFTAAELVKKVQQIHDGIGAATIYRNLPMFVAAGILRESLSDDKGQLVYETESHGHHDHIVCLDCHAILEFHEEEIEELQGRVMNRLGFKEARHQHVVYAHCEQFKGERGEGASAADG
jgi:Fur family ferric uptake transcriptional regulator